MAFEEHLQARKAWCSAEAELFSPKRGAVGRFLANQPIPKRLTGEGIVLRVIVIDEK